MELHHMSKKWNDHRSPERTKVWIEPHRNRRVPVVYYLCRNGQLEHPHFVEVSLSSPDGLYLRDVIDRLNSLRGKGMAALYSWSSKRSYKNGFVWHDLSVNDFIYPAHGQEYILKGSELFEATEPSKSDEALSSISKKSSSETPKSVDEFDYSVGRSRRNQSWSTVDLNECKVYSGESIRIAADASTQTNKTRRLRRAIISELEEDINNNNNNNNKKVNESSFELSRTEISPPPSDSSSETLESLMKSDGKLILRSEIDVKSETNPTVRNKMKASSVLMQLISCGSISFRDCGPGLYSKQNSGFSNYDAKIVTHGEGGSDRVEEGEGETGSENGVVSGRENRKGKKVNVLEDKEYFSGSLIMESKKDEIPGLKRSNSYNANG